MVKLIALDLDETLLDKDSQLSPRNRKAMERAQAMGAELVIATGRAYDTIPAEMLTFPGIRYAITGNGAAVYDVRTGEAVRRQVLPQDAPRQVRGAMAGLDVAYEIFWQGRAYAQADYLRRLDKYMMDGHRQDYVQKTRRPVEDLRQFVEAHAAELDSMAVIPADLPTRKEALARLRALEGVYVTTSHIRLIEVNHRDSTKASALRYLAKGLHVAQSDTAAFGNGDNDAEMLAWAGIGVSVAEGTALCRASADWVTGSYDADGAGEALERMFP